MSEKEVTEGQLLSQDFGVGGPLATAGDASLPDSGKTPDMADRSTGEMCMVEATPQIPGQMGFDGGEQERPVQLKIIRTA